MIREKKKFLEYPSKTVLEDLATRSGPATTKNFTPFTGCEDLLMQQFSNSQYDRFNYLDFLADNSSFEFNPYRAKVQAKVDFMETNKLETFERLEDFVKDGIENPVVKRWFRDACIGYKKHKASGYGEQTRTYVSSVSYGSDDSVFDFRETVIANPTDVSQEDIELALRKLPFYIKALWNQSVMFKANLFSFIVAFLGITKYKAANRITPRDFANYETYALKGSGEYMRPFDHSMDIRTDKYKNVIRIFERPDLNQEVYGLIKGFLQTCAVLDIDFEKQDTMIFNNEFVERIVCTYLPTTQEYFKYYGEVDYEVMYALKKDNLFTKSKAQIYVDPNSSIIENNERTYFRDLEDKLFILMKDYENKTLADGYVLFGGTEQNAKDLIDHYMQVVLKSTVSVANQLDTDTGMLVQFNDKPLVLKGNVFGKYLSSTDYDIMFTSYGSIIIYTMDAEDLIVMSYEDAEEKLLGVENGDADKWKNDWVVF